MKLYSLYIGLILFTIVCKNKQLPASKYKSLNIEIDSNESDLLRYDGIYNLYHISKEDDSLSILNRSKYFALSPMVFYKNNKVIKIFFSHYYKSELETYIPEFIKSGYYNYGNFKIKGYKLNIEMDYHHSINGMQERLFRTYFEGDIKNNDTIINFRMVPPYPSIFYKKVGQLCNENFEYELSPKMLVFKKFPAKTLIDSTKIQLNPKTRK
ncbi:MAG: hypothetical protein KA275_05860 [Chitinophagaceae bacterium]|nr:hypothetical protein [Chitinophagaceae bacterium]